jgi:hypothetical protein
VLAYRKWITFTSTSYRNHPIRIRRASSSGGRRRHLQRTSSLPSMRSYKPSCETQEGQQATAAGRAVPVSKSVQSSLYCGTGQAGCPVYDYYYLNETKGAIICIHCPSHLPPPLPPPHIHIPTHARRRPLCALVLDVVAQEPRSPQIAFLFEVNLGSRSLSLSL